MLAYVARHADACPRHEYVPVSLQQHCGAKVLVLIPPVAGAAGAAASAQNALIEPIQLAAVLLVLEKLLASNPAQAMYTC